MTDRKGLTSDGKVIDLRYKNLYLVRGLIIKRKIKRSYNKAKMKQKRRSVAD